MIVLKFGGSSVAGPSAIKRVASIVRSQMHRRPLVVVSAMGSTTDHLQEILRYASRAESYLAWKAIKDLKEYHFGVAEDLLRADLFEPLDHYLRETFRDLHVRIAEVCDGERELTTEFKDWVLSLGEQVSSRIVAAAFDDLGLPATHVDARTLILTDNDFTHATPRYWETYAKIRWAMPGIPKDRTPVLGGFIGATETGATTTLGRGGSDLTASIIGAAINAEEIQVWKDVDGMLTCDPKLKRGHMVRRLTYQEAAELAQAGAKILHPDTIAPAQRLRIPVVIRNTFHPEGAGTTIAAATSSASRCVKSIASQRSVTVLEIKSMRGGFTPADCSLALKQISGRSAKFAGTSAEALYMVLDSKVDHAQVDLSSAGCLEVHVRNDQSILTLVGENLAANSDARQQVTALLADASALILPQDPGSCSLRIVVPNQDLSKCLELLHNAFFAELDPIAFAEVTTNTHMRTPKPIRAESPASPAVLFPVRLSAKRPWQLPV